MAKNAYLSVGPRLKANTVGEPLPGQVANSTGGYVYQLDPFQRLRRFLILGSDAPTYYATAHQLSEQNAACIEACAVLDHERAIADIVAVSIAGNAPRNDPALFALAVMAGHKSPVARRAALSALPLVARTGSHLFAFMAYAASRRGKSGSLMKRAIQAWYNDKSVRQLAYQMVKYRERSGWTHRDVLRTVHIRPVDDAHNQLYRWALEKAQVELSEEPSPEDDYAQVWAFERCKNEHDKSTMLAMIERYDLTREMVPTWFLKDRDIWDALLRSMPMEAMLRNLVNMAEVGLLSPFGEATALVSERLGSAVRVEKSRLHPLKILVAAKKYTSAPIVAVPQIAEALDAAFYLAFGNVPTTGKNILLGVDVSDSMNMATVAGMSITPREAVAAMALVTMRREPNYFVAGFSDRFVPLPLNPGMSLARVADVMDAIPYGSTDMSLPMAFARDNHLRVDAFVTYTDNEVNTGAHARSVLRDYRAKASWEVRSIVVGTSATSFSIADPQDALSLDVVGFSTDAPQLIGGFIAGDY